MLGRQPSERELRASTCCAWPNASHQTPAGEHAGHSQLRWSGLRPHVQDLLFPEQDRVPEHGPVTSSRG
eukprot:5183965-Pyramimonas_sp.AAC.1